MFAYEYKFVLSKSSLVPLLSSALEDPRRGGGGRLDRGSNPSIILVGFSNPLQGGWLDRGSDPLYQSCGFLD